MSGYEGAEGRPSAFEEDESTGSVSSMGPPPEARLVTLRPTIETFGKYHLLCEMGHGGMADVYLAVVGGHAGFSRLQVIKRLRPSLAEDPELRAMLLDEARLAAQLHHRNIVQTLEVGDVDDRYFIAMELLDGQPFNRIIRRGKGRGMPLTLPLLVKILSEVLAGLHYAHEAKDYSGEPLDVVHRDVSPQNVFVTYDGQVKVMDFGIAKAKRRAVETQTGVVRGKVSYMAPEQALPKSSTLDRRADVFSVGVMLWEALTGERMWAGMGDPEILLKLSSAGAPALPARPGIPPELARICTRALMFDREQRYASAAEMRADLEVYLHKQVVIPSAEDLGDHVTQLFLPDQERMQKLIEHQLAALRSETYDEPPLSTGRRSMASISGAERRTGTTDGTGVNQPMVKSSPAPSPSERSPSFTPGRALLAALAFGALAGGVFVMRHRLLGEGSNVAAASSAAPLEAVSTALPTAAPSAASSATAQSTARPAAPVQEAGYIRVHIAATPPTAHISLDGIQVENPFESKLVKDSAMHRLLIDAPGFLSQGRMVAFDNDVELTVALKPRDKAAAPLSTGAAPVAPPPPSLPPLKPR